MRIPVIRRSKFVIAWFFIVGMFLFIIHSPSLEHYLLNAFSGAPAEWKNVSPRYAYATILTENGLDIDEDNYFLAARLLTYQLVHDPFTKTKDSIPLIIAVTKAVAEAKRDRLRRDGAIVFEPEEVTVEWAENHPTFTEPRWKGLFTKLRFWEMTQFDRICLFDTDTIINGNMDGIFRDPAVKIQTTKDNATHVKDDEAPLPATYAIASRGELRYDHDFPPKEDQYYFGPFYFNAGFLVFRPSQDLFDYYISLANISDGRWLPHMLEQNLLNYAHRDRANMPWQRLNPIWNTHRPTLNDQVAGVKSLHEKFWAGEHKDLRPYLEEQKSKMLAFYEKMERKEFTKS